MNLKLVRAFIIGAIALSAATTAYAQQSGPTEPSVDRGKYEYDAHCATCHGLKGEGNGPYAGFVIKVCQLLQRFPKGMAAYSPLRRCMTLSMEG